MQTEITQEVLNQYLKYEPNTGHLYWIKRPSRNIHINTRAGSQTKEGYRQITLFGKNYPEHRVIWCMVHGEFPNHLIDHINHIRDDNRIENLRQVTKAENARNRRRNTNTPVNEAGIWYCKRRKRYIAEITLNQKKVWQRSFTDINQAIKQRKAKTIELGFHQNHGDEK